METTVERWLAEIAVTHAPTTRERYGVILRGLAGGLGEGVSLETCEAEDVRSYLAARNVAGISVRTQRQTLSALRSWALWAIHAGLRASDPTRGVPWPRLPTTRERPLSSAQLHQLARLLDGDPPRRQGVTAWHFARNRRAILLMLYAGLRLSEMGALMWPCVDLAAGLLYVEDGKGGKDRTLPIHRTLAAALRAVDAPDRVGPVVPSRRGGVMSPDTLAHICQRWLPAMGIAGVAAHSLRRTCATLMRRRGADLEAIREMLGHASMATTQVYLGPDPELLRRGVAALPDLAELLDAAPDIRALPKRRKEA